MKTIEVYVDESIVDDFYRAVEQLPRDKFFIVNPDIPEVSDEEQAELEEILKNPDCHEIAFTETIDL